MRLRIQIDQSGTSFEKMKRHRKISFLLGEESAGMEGHSLGVNCVAYSSDGKVVSGGRDATIRIWDGGVVSNILADHADAVHDVAVIPSTNMIVSCSADNTILVYNNGKIVEELVTHTDAVRKVKVASSSAMMSVSLDGTLCVHDLRSTAAPATVVKTGDPLFALAVGARDGKYMVAVGSALGHVYMVDPRAPQSSDTLAPAVRSAHKSCVRDLIFCEGASKLVSCGADSMVRIWDTRMLRSPMSCVLHSDSVMSLAAFPSNSTVLSGSRDGTVAATSLRTLQSSQVVAMSYPVTCVSVSPKGVVFVCSSKSSIDGYVASNLVPSSLLHTPGVSSLDVSPEVITPSKVSLELDMTPEHHHRPSVNVSPSPLILTDPISRKYEATHIRTVEFASVEEQQHWCTSAEVHRPKSLARAPLSEPDLILKGSGTAILHCCLLNDKRHLLAVDESNRVTMWNICEQRLVQRFALGVSLRDALSQSQVLTHCPSWCSVECRWGYVCVTLSPESSLDTYVNKWWLEFCGPPNTTSKNRSPQARSSIYTLSRKQRLEYQQAPEINLGETAIRSLLTNMKLSVVVWAVPAGSNILQGGGKRYSLAAGEDVKKFLPSWVGALFVNPKQGPNSSAHSATHTLELLPYQKSLPPLKQTQYNIPKRKSFAEVAAELVAVLKLKLPKTKELLAQLSDSSLSWPSDDSGNAEGAEESQTLSLDSTTLQPDEFIEFIPPGDDGQPHPALVVDPMMTVTTAFFVFKERGSGILRLWYRKNSLLPQ